MASHRIWSGRGDLLRCTDGVSAHARQSEHDGSETVRAPLIACVVPLLATTVAAGHFAVVSKTWWVRSLRLTLLHVDQRRGVVRFPILACIPIFFYMSLVKIQKAF